MTSYEPSWSLVKKYLERAVREHNIVRKQVATALDVTPPALSAWATDNEERKMSPAKLQAFAKAVRLSEWELVELTAIRLMEEDGKKPALDLSLVIKLIEYLLPRGDEKALIDILNEETTQIGFNYRLFDCEENRSVIREAIKVIVQKECSDLMAET